MPKDETRPQGWRPFDSDPPPFGADVLMTWPAWSGGARTWGVWITRPDDLTGWPAPSFWAELPPPLAEGALQGPWRSGADDPPLTGRVVGLWWIGASETWLGADVDAPIRPDLWMPLPPAPPQPRPQWVTSGSLDFEVLSDSGLPGLMEHDLPAYIDEAPSGALEMSLTLAEAMPMPATVVLRIGDTVARFVREVPDAEE